RLRWAAVPERDGIPDGLTIDSEGCLWLALWDGGRVLRYSPDGQVIGEVRLPVSRVTSCAFGGARLDRLFITTAAVGSSSDDPPRPHDGALFVIEPGVVGVGSVVAGGRH
ncbi:MAG: SMP-30/gluconolactonase/LRE family protein, partial [Acidimicrobiia bacterium]|nr:SMP-30/gluconolactonase/LRE family protein [Acidimicrobiia bacterium]